MPGQGTYNFSTTAVASGGGGINGNFTIIKQLFNALTATDTITVYDLPPLSTITSSSGGFNMCSTAPIALSVDTGYLYQWYLNDTTLLIGADSSSYVIPDPGDYPTTSNFKVKIIDPFTGCAVITPNTAVTITAGIPTAFGNVGAMYGGGVLSTNYSYPNYQWLLNGSPMVPPVQTQSFTPTQNGSYSLVATTAAGCTDTSNVVNVFDVSIENFSTIDQNISVYPNPSNGEFTLHVNAELNSGLTVSMIDISGKTVYTENVGHVNGLFNKTFNLQHLSSGVYTLNISLDQGTVRRKIIIQ